MKPCDILFATGMALALISSGRAIAASPEIEEITLVRRLTIQGEVGATNVIEYAEALATNQWTVLTNVVVSQNPYVVVDTTAAVSNRFYRLVILGATNVTTGMVWINPGTFTMGSPTNEVDRNDNEGPQTQVTISKGFWMSQHETTQGEYQSVMGNNPSQYTGNDNLPVELVRWSDATNYCAKLTARELAAGRLQAGYTYRLPTEAEWGICLPSRDNDAIQLWR